MPHSEQYDRRMHHELSTEHHDPLIRYLHQVIRFCVKLLAILMVLVILMGVVDVCYVFYQRLIAPPFLLLSVSDLFKAFGAFMVVLIAIEIFINIRLYAIAAVVLALGVAYWLVGKTSRLLTEAGEAGDDVKALVPDD